MSQSPILIYQPGGGTPIGGAPGGGPVYSQADTTQLVAGQAYVDVVFGSIQTTDEWVLVECVVVNELDAEPLNIWPGIITDKTATGFRLQLNGLPDSGNYYLHWAVSGINITPSPASTYYLTGPATGSFGSSSTFTVALPASTTVPETITVTPSDGGAGGTFAPVSVALSNGSASATFTYTPASYGAKTISVTNSGTLINPVSLTFTPLSSTYTLSGPSSGATGTESSNFTVALPVGGVVSGTVVVTPNDGGGGGTFTPATVNLTTGAPSNTFTYTPTSAGVKTIGTTNNGGLTNPASLTYTAAAFDPTGIAGLKLWLKADSLALADGALVGTWNDSSGTGYNLTVNIPFSSMSPTFKTNIVNGKPVIRFDGVSNYLANAASTGIAQPDTIFVVGKHITDGNNCWFIYPAGAVGGLQGIALNGTGQIVAYSGTSFPTDTVNSGGAFHVFSVIFASGNATAYRDGILRFGPSASGAAGVGTINLMNDQAGVSEIGDIAEILIYNSALSTTNRQSVEGYLRGKYATP